MGGVQSNVKKRLRALSGSLSSPFNQDDLEANRGLERQLTSSRILPPSQRRGKAQPSLRWRSYNLQLRSNKITVTFLQQRGSRENSLTYIGADYT